MKVSKAVPAWVRVFPAPSVTLTLLLILKTKSTVAALKSRVSSPPLSSTTSAPQPSAKKYVSFPKPLCMVSFPGPPVIALALSLPIMSSSPLPPITFSRVPIRVRVRLALTICTAAVEMSITTFKPVVPEKSRVSVPHPPVPSSTVSVPNWLSVSKT